MDRTNELGHEVKKTLDQITTLGGEIRLKLHLAGMDAKDAWNRLEPRLSEAEALAKQATEASKLALHELAAEVKRIRDSIAS